MNGEERELLERCRRGEESAWREVYVRNAPMVGRFLQRMLGPGPDIEDLVQSVFVEFLATADRYRGDGSLATWLYGIAVHVAHRGLRTKHRHERRSRAYGEWMTATGSGGGDLGSGAETREILQVVASALDRMDIRLRTVWILREWEGFRSEEVARVLDIPVGTVRSRLCTARRSVIAALDKAGVEVVDGETDVDGAGGAIVLPIHARGAR